MTNSIYYFHAMMTIKHTHEVLFHGLLSCTFRIDVERDDGTTAIVLYLESVLYWGVL